MKISVIVPVYNKQSFLRGCLDSIRSQSFPDLQVVLFDDCSTDDSVRICEEYVQKDNRFTLRVHKENKGQQATIVDALALADGDWVAFVDSDDTLPHDALSTLSSFADDSIDIVVGFAFDWDGTTAVVPIREWRADMIKSDVVLCTRWAKLYRRRLLDAYTCSVPDGIRLGEDEIMNIKVAFRTEKPVRITRQKVYEYNQNETSYSVSHRWTVEKYARLYYAVQDSIPQPERSRYAKELAYNGIGMIRHIVLRGSRAEQCKLPASPFFGDVSALKESSGITLSRTDAFMMKHPASLMTRFLVRSRRGFAIIFRRLFKK